MLANIILLILALALIIYGADYFTEGASDVARRMSVSDLVVGLTIVAFGTSAPELAISVISAAQHSAGIAIGNVIGSNIFNTFLIIGCVALIRPIKIEKSILNNEIPLVLLATIALIAIGASEWLDGTMPVITRVDGILLLLFFTVFMRYVCGQAMNKKLPEADKRMASEAEDNKLQKAPKRAWVNIVMILGGLAALIYGGDLFVDKASAIASALGVSDAIIGLTIVAIGTSLPELAASVSAALKGNTGMALGNVIGSNIFNIFMVLGCASVVSPLPFAGVSPIDMSALLVSAVLFFIFGWLFGNRVINRTEGAILTACYLIYIIITIINNI